MGLFSGKSSARAAYTTEPGTDPESGEAVVNLRSGMTGGHVVSSHATKKEAKAEADRLAAMWDALDN